ncbi:MAG: DUF4097 family beta strand repeat protein [Clostridia bacterium]|nr:DUF4097 family beta strand repeat protein [Clostridia bacterium]
MLKKRIWIPALALAVLLLVMLAGCHINIMGKIGGVTTVTYEKPETYAPGDASYAGIPETLFVDWVSGPVLIAYDMNIDCVQIREKSDSSLPPEWRMQTRMEDGELNIEYSEPGNHTFGTLTKSLEILLPYGTQIGEIEVDSVAGGVNSSVTCTKISVKTISGAVYIADSLNVYVDKTSGMTTISTDRLETLDYDSISGNLYVSCDTFGSIRIDKTSGDADIKAAQTTGFTLHYSSLSRSFESEFELQKKSRDTYVFGDGTAVIDIDSTSGGLRLTKSEGHTDKYGTD